MKPRDYWVLDPSSPLGVRKCQTKIIDTQPKTDTIKTMKKLHLVTAVASVIAAHQKAVLPFSAWNITSAIRDMVNNGELTIVEGNCTSFGNAVKIPHADVRDIVKELHDEKLFDAVVNDNGQFREYHWGAVGKFLVQKAPTLPTQAPNTPVGPQANDIFNLRPSHYAQSWNRGKIIEVSTAKRQVKVKHPTYYAEAWFSFNDIDNRQGSVTAPVPVSPVATVATVATVAASALKAPDAEMWQKAENYIKVNGTRTLKQIQSRLKGWKVTVKEIAEHFATSKNAKFFVRYATPFANSVVS